MQWYHVGLPLRCAVTTVVPLRQSIHSQSCDALSPRRNTRLHAAEVVAAALLRVPPHFFACTRRDTWRNMQPQRTM
jgi:hypothetical protein